MRGGKDGALDLAKQAKAPSIPKSNGFVLQRNEEGAR